MPDLDEENPYEKQELKQAWLKGYRAAVKEVDLPASNDSIYDRVEKDLAWIKGYTSALVLEQE